jgi:hypothetical protein
MSSLLQSKIDTVRRKHSIVAATRGVAALVAAAILLLAFGMIMDWAFELPRVVRVALLAVDLTVLTYIFLTYVLAPIIWGPDDDELALMVERGNPDLATRLIAAIQLSRPEAIPAGASREIVGALVAQTESVAEPMDFAAVVKTELMLKTLAVSSLILVLGVGTFAYTNEVSPDLLKRAFLSNVDVPRKTRVKIDNPDQVIAIGDPVTLSAVASGVVPTSGKVDVKYDSGRTQTFQFDAVRDAPGRFTRTIENVQETFTYRIRLNDNTTSRHTVKALPRPSVLAVGFTIAYPEYLKRGQEPKSPGDLSLLVGSTLSVKVKASKPLKSGTVRLVGRDQDVELAVGGAKKDELTGSFPVPQKGLTGLSFTLKDEHGIVSKNETVYPVELVPDRDPTVRILVPEGKEELATQQAKVLISFEATDDFGVAKVFLHRKLAEDENAKAKSIELDLSDVKQDDARRLLRRYYFDLGALKLPEGTVVEYWLEVQDGNDVTGPGKASSEHFRVKIVSELEKRADLMNRLNDELGRIDNVTQDQEKLNQTLGKMILEKQP